MTEDPIDEKKINFEIESKTVSAYQKQRRKQKINNRISKKEFNIKLKEYFKSRLVRDYLNIVLASICAMVAYDYFIAATTSNGLTPSGFSAIARGIAVSIWPNNLELQTSMYWVFYLVINIPLFVFATKKIGLRFAVRSIYFIILQNIFHFAIMYIPYINPQTLHFIYYFENPESIINQPNQNIWMFVFAVVAALLNGASYGLLYKSGASSGGSDFIFGYISTKNKKSIAKYNKTLNFFIITFMIALRTILIKNTSTNNKIEYFFGPVLFASLLFVVLQAFVTDVIFPKYKYRSIIIITNNASDIINGLNFIKYENEITRFSATSAIAQAIVDNKETIINKEILIIPSSLAEYKKIKAAIVISDPNAKIISLRAEQVVNYFI